MIEAEAIIDDEECYSYFKENIGQLSSVQDMLESYNISYNEKHLTDLIKINERYIELNYWKSYKTKYINYVKDELLRLLTKSVEYNYLSDNKYIRKLNENAIIEKNIISVFESTLTRTLGIKKDELSMDIIVVKVYYFDIIKDLILNGFEYNGERYRFFTASAGQIRTKKTVFIKESLWNKYEKTLMCGLTVDSINSQGGINVNKFLAYLALSNSATDRWDTFDIDKCIVIPDFETEVHGTVDFISDITYEVERKEMDIAIEHTDGCGMILPTLSKKNFMVRLPWVKGLLASFDFREFIKENQTSTEIEDIYGVKHDIFAEDIQIIFTKSQFKAHKFYKNWDEYKKYFKEYDCQAGTCKMEEDRIEQAHINYQMLQTLTDVSDDEIKKICAPANKQIEELTSTVKGMLDVFGASRKKEHMNAFQEALYLYPEMLHDQYCKKQLNDLKNSLIRKYYSGKLPVKGKYTFVIPDLYAACEYWFMGNENPDGLLENRKVSCNLYPKTEKLDCLRPPHLYREHAVRENIVNEDIQKWFKTNAIYTSCKDMISKILQFDNDGDTLLVVADETITSVAERNMQGIVPLYYDMKKAESVILTRKKFYEGMMAAWTGGNIGAISNNITKIWNCSDHIDDEAILAVKLLCMENNFVID